MVAIGGCATKEVVAPYVPLEQCPFTITIFPGYPVSVDQQHGKLYGTDACREADSTQATRLLFWPDPEAEQESCLVIEPGKQTVSARIELEGSSVVETLSIQLDGDFVRFKRPDGSNIEPAIHRFDNAFDTDGPC